MPPKSPRIRVAEVKIQSRRADRRTVILEDGRVLGISGEIYLERPLYAGDELSEEDVAAITARNEQQYLRDATLNLLSYRARSRGELRQRLREKGWSASAIVPLLEQLSAQGLLDDLEFARSWARDKIKFRLLGPQALAGELRKKLLPKELVQTVLAEFYPPGREVELIGQVLDLKNVVTGQVLSADQRRKLCAYLSRKGFGWQSINAVLHERGLV